MGCQRESILLVLILSSEIQCAMNEVDGKKILDGLLFSYDRTISPRAYSGNGVAVTDIVQLYVKSIDSISDSTMDYTMSFYLRQRWFDPRLIYNGTEAGYMEIHSQIIDKLWLPDLSFINEKDAHFHDVSRPNKMMNLFADGRISYSIRITGTFSCNMDFHKYPLDLQICHVKMESYGYTADTLTLRWNDPPVKIDSNIQIPQFSIVGNRSYICDQKLMEFNYTCIGYEFHLQREIGYYVIQVYVPTTLIVVLSWVSFWLDVEATAARISLGLLTVLTMTTQSAGRSDLQKVSYIKASDVWLATCLVFVFAALIEFAYVNVNARFGAFSLKSGIASIAYSLEPKSKYRNGSVSSSMETIMRSTEGSSETNSSSKNEKSHRIDRFSRIAFPCVFAFFNIVYWAFYSLWKPV